LSNRRKNRERRFLSSIRPWGHLSAWTPARSRGTRDSASLFPDRMAGGGANTRRAEYARAPSQVRLRSSTYVGCNGGQATECKTADLLAPTANLYYTAIHRAIRIQPTRACFALCIVHVSTNITCNKIDVGRAHVDKPFECAYLFHARVLYTNLRERSVCACWP